MYKFFEPPQLAKFQWQYFSYVCIIIIIVISVFIFFFREKYPLHPVVYSRCSLYTKIFDCVADPKYWYNNAANNTLKTIRFIFK